MTVQEAVSVLKELQGRVSHSLGKAVAMAIRALEDKVPREPKVATGGQLTEAEQAAVAGNEIAKEMADEAWAYLNRKNGEGQYSFEGYDAETGKGIYRSNFQIGTPKAAKAERILSYIQNVWSKKPISLKIKENGNERVIQAQFDPTHSSDKSVRTDATKLMGGNRHGNASEQRVTLDLADDYYQIASGAEYNYSKDETGKTSGPHHGVTQWHYFVNDILFRSQESDNLEPYRVTINVKEKADGHFVYSFNAESQTKKEDSSTRRTLHADVSNTRKEGITNTTSSDTNIPQDGDGVNTYSMPEDGNYTTETAPAWLAELSRDEALLDATAMLERLVRMQSSGFRRMNVERARDTVEALLGMKEKYTPDQQTVANIGQRLGYTVKFGDVYVRDSEGHIVVKGGVKQRANAVVRGKDITIDQYCTDPIRALLHETAHPLEVLQEYHTYLVASMESGLFGAYIEKQAERNAGYGAYLSATNRSPSKDSYRAYIIQQREGHGDPNFVGKSLREQELAGNREMLADFVADVVFSGEQQVKRLLADMDMSMKERFVRALVSFFQRLKKRLQRIDVSVDKELNELQKGYTRLMKQYQDEGAKVEADRYSVNFNLPISEIRRLIDEPAIDVSQQEWAMLQSQRMSRYGGKTESEIPSIDIFLFGGYHYVNEGNYYYVRSYGLNNFDVVEMGGIDELSIEEIKEALKNHERMDTNSANGYRISREGGNRGGDNGYRLYLENRGTPVADEGSSGSSEKSVQGVVIDDSVDDSAWQRDTEGGVIPGQYSLSAEMADTLLDQYNAGTLSKEEFKARITGQRTQNPMEIADDPANNEQNYPAFELPKLTRPEDNRPGGTNERKSYQKTLDSELYDQEMKELMTETPPTKCTGKSPARGRWKRRGGKSSLGGASESGLQYILGGKVTGKSVEAVAKGVDKAIGRFALRFGDGLFSSKFLISLAYPIDFNTLPCYNATIL